MAGTQAPAFAGLVNYTTGASGLTAMLTPNIPLIAGGNTWGYKFAETIAAPTAPQAQQVSTGMRNDLTITGNTSNWSGGTSDIVSGNFTVAFNNTGTMPTATAFQAALYINGGGAYSGLTGFKLHLENNTVGSTISSIAGYQPIFTNNAGAVNNLYWFLVPDTRSTPGGGTITNEWALYNPNPNAKLETLGLGRFAKIDVTANDVSGVNNGFYLSASGQLVIRAAGVDQARTTSDCFQILTGFRQATVTVTAAGTITVVNSNQIILVNKTTGAATTVNLPASPGFGRRFWIKDAKGDAATNNITIVPPSGTIDGAANVVINTNYGKVNVVYDGANWFTL